MERSDSDQEAMDTAIDCEGGSSYVEAALLKKEAVLAKKELRKEGWQ